MRAMTTSSKAVDSGGIITMNARMTRSRRVSSVLILAARRSSMLVVVPTCANKTISPDSGSRKSLYRLWIYDAGGDGWGSCLYSITHATSTFDDLEVVPSGSLDTGHIFDERVSTDDCTRGRRGQPRLARTTLARDRNSDYA